MISTTALYATENGLQVRTPVYLATFKGRYDIEVLIDSPSLYCGFGDSALSTLVDLSVNGLNGTYFNAPQLNVAGALIGVTDTAARFNAVDQYATVADNDLLDFGDTFSIDGWMWWDGAVSNPYIADKGANGLAFYHNNGSIAIAKSGGATIVTATVAATAGTWAHVGVTKSGATTKLYLNGADVTGAVSNQTIASTAVALNLARYSGASNYFSGRLQKLAFYPTALSAARIKAHYDARGRQFSTAPVCDYSTEVMADAPVGRWRVGEAVGPGMSDSSGNGLTGIYHGSPTLGVTGAIAGSSDTAVTLNGSSQYGSVADNDLLDLTTLFTLECWFKWVSGDSNIFAKEDISGTTVDSYIFGIQSGSLNLTRRSDDFAACSASISANVWHHACVVFDNSQSTGSKATFYLDGAVKGKSSDDIAGAFVANSQTLLLGAIGSGFIGGYFNGSLDELAIYRTGLSASRIAAHYQAGRRMLNRASVLDYMQLPQAVASQVIPDRGQSSIGGMNFVIEDDAAGSTTNFVMSGIGNQQVVMQFGFDDLQIEDFTTFLTGIVTASPMTPDLTGYQIQIADAQILANLNVFNVSSSALKIAMGSGDTSLTIADSTDFLSAGYVRVDNEVIQYSSKSDTGIAIADQSWSATAYGNGTFVAVATDGSISKSSDGENWASIVTPEANYWTGVCWAAGLNLFVAVAATGTHRVMTSPDGVTWTVRTAAAALNWAAVTWSPDLTLLAAVASDTSNALSRIMTSPDGITWTSRDGNVPSSCITWSTDVAVFTTVGMYSADGSTWTSVSPLLGAGAWASIAYSSALGLWVAVDSTNTLTWAAATSPDGKNWTLRVTPNGGWNCVIWSPDLALFVAVGFESTTGRVMTSSDGIVWTSRTPSANKSWHSVAWSPSLSILVAVNRSADTSGAMSSPDGITWTTRTTVANVWGGVAWSPSLALFCAIGNSGTSRLMTSADGTTWTSILDSVSGLDQIDYRSIAWSPSLSLFVAVAVSEVTGSHRVATSSTGALWTMRTAASSNDWDFVMWSSVGSLFIALATAGTTSRVMTSPDGTTWTGRSTPSASWVSAETDGATVIALSGVSASGIQMSSTDGTTWATSAVSVESAGWSGVAWSQSLNLFFATATVNDGFRSSNKGATSSDAATWTMQSGTSDYSVIWVASLALFVSVGNNSVHTSANGTSWTSRTPAANNYWKSVAFSGSLLAALSDSGTSSRNMYSSDGVTWTLSRSQLAGLMRGVTIAGIATAAATHALGATISEVLVIGPIHPMDELTAVLENTDKTGCSISSSLVNFTSIAAAKTAIGSTYQMEWVLTKATNAKAWIETELMLATASYLIMSSGKFGVTHFAAATSPSATIDHDSIMTGPQLSHDPNFLSMINSVTINYDYDPILTNTYGSSSTLTNPASIARYGQTIPLIINSQGLRSSIAGTSDFIAAIQNAILARFANGGAPITRATVFFSKHLIEAGDIVALTSALLPDRATGLRGVSSQAVEVINRTVDPSAGNVKLEMLWT